jgi:hypothetical protein
MANDLKESAADVKQDTAASTQRHLAAEMVRAPISDIELMQAFMAAMSVRSPGTRIRIRFDAMPMPAKPAKKPAKAASKRA